MAYLPNIHRFRSLAIIGIVAAHSLHNFTWDQDDLRFRLVNTLVNESSIWFFAIAGFLFQHLNARFEYKIYLAKKAKTVLLPYLLISIPALIGSLTFYDQGMAEGFAEASIPKQILLLLVTGNHMEPLWFVPTICLIFLITPLLLWADRLRWPYIFLIVLLPLSAWLGREGVLIHFMLDGHWSALSKAVYLVPVFGLGMLCSRYQILVFQLVAHWKWPLLTATVAAYAYAVIHNHMAHVTGIFPFKILSVPLLLYALQSRPAALLDRLSILGHTSFGIFFIHCYFLFALRLVRMAVGLPERMSSDLPGVAALTAACLALSVTTIHVLQRCFGARCQLLVGCTIPVSKAPPRRSGHADIMASLQARLIVAAR